MGAEGDSAGQACIESMLNFKSSTENLNQHNLIVL